MTPFRAALPVLIVCGALAGCGAPSKTAGADAGRPASQGAGADPTPASVAMTAKGAPRRADGYWQMASFTETGAPMSTQFLCVGGGSEEKFSVFDQLAMVGDCSKKQFTRTATGWSFETRCTLMDHLTVQTGAIRGDFQNGFRVDQTVTQGATAIKGSIRGQRTGDCPAQFKPGDLVDEHGGKLGNMLAG